MAYDAIQNAELECRRLSGILKQYPRGPMGLITDEAKSTPEYRAAKSAYNEAFARLQKINSAAVKERRKRKV